MDARTLKELWKTHTAQPTAVTAELILLNMTAFARAHTDGQAYPWSIPMSLMTEVPARISEKQLADMLGVIVDQVTPSYAYTIFSTLMTGPLQHATAMQDVLLKSGLKSLMEEINEDHVRVTAANIITWVLGTNTPTPVQAQLDRVARRKYRRDESADMIAGGCHAITFEY